jgi:hypothetical protein
MKGKPISRESSFKYDLRAMLQSKRKQTTNE